VEKGGDGGVWWKRGGTVGNFFWYLWLLEMEVLCHRCLAFGSALLLVVSGGRGKMEMEMEGEILGDFKFWVKMKWEDFQWISNLIVFLIKRKKKKRISRGTRVVLLSHV